MAALQNDIYIGSVAQPLYHYSNRSIEMGTPSGLFSVDTIGNELSIDTFSLSIRWRFDTELIYAPKGKDGYLDTNDKLYRTAGQYYNFIPRNSDALVDANGAYFRSWGGKNAKDYLSELEYGTPVFWYVTNSFFTKGYLKSVERIGKYEWKLTCISGVGLLDTQYHVGGIYNGATVKSVVQSIIGDTFKFTMAADVSSTLLYGHLPYDTCRNNLHRVLFAVGASLVRNNVTYDYNIKFVTETAPVSVPTSRIAMGGSVNTQLPANHVEITEHAYSALETDAEETLFDNTQGGQAAAVGTVVTFKEPMHDLATTENLSVSESGVNYAVVYGTGVLTGKKYTHTEQIIELGGGNPKRTKRVTDNHLVSFANSANVAQRVLNYYSTARTVKAKIMLQNEKCGNILSMTDMFGDATIAFLERMTILVTSVKGASCELIEGYKPSGSGNNYTHHEFIGESGTWTVPAGVGRIRLVLVGGGTGGQGGYSGQAGRGGDRDYGGDLWFESGSYVDGNIEYFWEQYSYGNQEIPLGGTGGAGGAGGKILILDVDVTSGEVITFATGIGGNGGDGGAGGRSKTSAAGTAGANGSATTASSASIGTVTSDDGVSLFGFTDPFTGEAYGIGGVVGTSGGNGGRTDIESLWGYYGAAGLAGADVGTYKGGKGGAGNKRTSSGDNTWNASGGGGGGAAVGNNGGNGTNGTQYARAGSGGTGADAMPPSKATYGNGGDGGNGGGGGGNGAGSMSKWDYVARHPTPGAGGHGGSGSVGGEGGDGCAIILY